MQQSLSEHSVGPAIGAQLHGHFFYFTGVNNGLHILDTIC